MAYILAQAKGGSGGGITKVQIPSVVIGSYTYDGTAQGPTITGLDTTHCNVTGTTSATDAGTYTITISLKDPDTMIWNDISIADKVYTWSIAKASQSLSLSANSVTLDNDHLTGTVTVSGAMTSLLVSSSDTSIATASVNNSTVTIDNVNNTNGSATITVTAASDTNYNSATATISVTAAFTVLVYGAEWDGTSTTAWSRTDDAASFTDPVPAVNNGNGSSPFDNILPWSGMERVTDATAGTLVKIPKYYYKWTRSGASMKLQISDLYFDGSLISPAHADRGDGVGERDFVYVGAYHCSDTYKSLTGVKPKSSETRASFRANIHALGSDIWQYDYAIYWTIMMLYLVEYADWNSQEKIGYGCNNGTSIENTGLTDAMTYHTGTNQSNRTSYGHTRYRYIEDLWGNVFDYCDGIYFDDTNIYGINNPNSYSDSSNGTLIGTRANAFGYTSAWTNPSAISGFEYALCPSAINGNQNTYICDRYGYNAAGVSLRIGGAFVHDKNYGAFAMFGTYEAERVNADAGSRLQKLPA